MLTAPRAVVGRSCRFREQGDSLIAIERKTWEVPAFGPAYAAGELPQAVDAFERALAAGGPLSDVVGEELVRARAELARERSEKERRDGAQAQ